MMDFAKSQKRFMQICYCNYRMNKNSVITFLWLSKSAVGSYLWYKGLPFWGCAGPASTAYVSQITPTTGSKYTHLNDFHNWVKPLQNWFFQFICISFHDSFVCNITGADLSCNWPYPTVGRCLWDSWKVAFIKTENTITSSGIHAYYPFWQAFILLIRIK